MRDQWGRVAEWVTAFSDVHERHLAEVRERNTADRFRRIFAANVFGVCYGEHRRILDANDAMLRLLGYRRRDLSAGINVEDLTVGADAHGPLGTGAGREFTITRPDGSTAHLLAAGVSLAPERGWIAVAVDVTQRKTMEREAEQRALHDALTGLANRRLLVDRLEHAITRAERQGSAVGVLFCDLDHFKTINDRYGHATGDRVLQTVAQRLQALMRESDTVARIGGDEFVVVLEDLNDGAVATAVAERLRGEVEKPVPHEGNNLEVTCSIGVTSTNEKEQRPRTS